MGSAPNLAPTTFERALRVIAPGMAKSRYQSRIAFESLELQSRAQLKAADRNRTTDGWRSIDGDLHDVVQTDRKLIAERARHLATSTSAGVAAKTALLDSVIGTGMQVQSKAQFSGPDANEDELKNQLRLRQIMDERRRWWNEDLDWEESGSHWYDMQALNFTEIMVPGEVIVRYMIEPQWQRKGMRIPLRLHQIRSERLTNWTTNPQPGNEVYDGIEFDQYGRKVAFHIESDDYRRTVTRVPAGEILHGYRRDWPSQRRGLSWFAPIIPEMQDFEELKAYALIAKKVQAAIAIIVTNDNPSKPTQLPGLSGQDPTNDENGTPLRAIEPGMIHNAGSGRVHSHAPSPTGDSELMAKLFQRSIGVGFGLSYEEISGDWSGVNFAGGRLGVLRTRKRVSSIHAFYQRQVEAPIHRKFLRYSQIFDDEMRMIMRQAQNDPTAATFSRPKFDWGVNPVQEVKAAILSVQHGLSTLEEEVGSRGGDWAAYMTQNAHELNFEEALAADAPMHPANLNQQKATA